MQTRDWGDDLIIKGPDYKTRLLLEPDDDDLPEIVSAADYLVKLPDLKNELIAGVLRQGHKMLLAGPSKAGKSFALIELCIAIAEGRPWLGFDCAQGRVLYVNLELDRASCLKANGCTAVILDPIYKLGTGNENDARAISSFCNGLDRISDQTGCAVIYCHHHSKGDQSWKVSADRAAGSGVFARDVDALLDVIELELPPGKRRDGVTAWRIEGTLREFARFEPVDVWFNYPIHVMEHFDTADNVAPHAQLPPHQRAMNARKSKKQKLRERQHRLEAAVDILQADGKAPTIQALAEYLGVSTRTIRNMVDEHPAFDRDNSKSGSENEVFRSQQNLEKNRN